MDKETKDYKGLQAIEHKELKGYNNIIKWMEPKEQNGYRYKGIEGIQQNEQS